jgi:WD40-like Beta Propeller Repeat.
MKKIFMTSILVLLIKSSFGQQFTDLYGDYLGQPVPGDTPMVFAPGIISKNGLEHSAAIFSNDGNEVYWCSIEAPIDENVKKIWFMKRINNRWTIPRVLDFLGDSLHTPIDNPFLSFDDKRLYFNLERYKPQSLDDKYHGWKWILTNEDIWYAEKQSQGWSKPQSLSPIVNDSGLQIQATFNKEGTVYFLGYLKGKECGIFRSKFKNGNYLKPDTLPSCINFSPSMNWTPYIARDDSYLIFSSNRHNVNDGGDLYISFHDINKDTWTEPMNMGEPINTWAQERFPAVSPDGKYLFFTRWTENNHMDIFWVSAKIIDRLREKNNIKK